MQLLFDLLEDHRNGLLFHYFSSVDLNSHMFWATMDETLVNTLSAMSGLL